MLAARRHLRGLTEAHHYPEEYTMTGNDTHIDSAEDTMLTLDEAAALVRAPVATLRYWRHMGTGPRSF